MREHITSRIAAVLLSANCLAGYAVGATVTVDVNTWHQKISGFGTCSAWNGTLTASEGEQLFDTIRGAGLSLHRIQIERNGADQYEANNAKLAASYGVKVWGTPWYCKNGIKLDGRDYDTLYESNMQEWADTLAATANKLKNMGAPLYAISSGNEVDLGWTKYSPEALVKWVGKYMGPTLASKAPETKVMGIETCNWCGFSGFYRAFEADPDAWKYSSILATHMYGCWATAYPKIHAEGKEFWQTEIYDTQTDVEDPGMGSALRVCKLIHEALTVANMNAWHFWWIKPCHNCYNGALWVEATNQPSKRLWIMGNWSRYVRPGFVRVEAQAEPTPGVNVTAFRDSVLSKIVIVAFNNNTSEVSQEFSIPGTFPKMLTPCITDPTRNLVVQPSRTLSSSTFTYSLPALSVTSLVIDLQARPDTGDIVLNGGFSDGTSNWTLNVWGGAASGSVDNGEYRIDIESIADNSYDIQLVQSGLPLKNGQTYRVTFDAYAAADRTLEVNVEMADDPWTSYLPELRHFNLTTAKQTYSFTFTMEQPTDVNGRLGFNAGTGISAVTIDNVSVEAIDPTSSKTSRTKISTSAFKAICSKASLQIEFTASYNGKISLQLYNMKGDMVQNAAIRTTSGKTYTQRFDPSHIPNGFYIIRAGYEKEKFSTLKVLFAK